MVRVVVLLSVLMMGLTQEDFFNKYAFNKVISSCFGSGEYGHYLSQISSAQVNCNQQPITAFLAAPGRSNPNVYYSSRPLSSTQTSPSSGFNPRRNNPRYTPATNPLNPRPLTGYNPRYTPTTNPRPLTGYNSRYIPTTSPLSPRPLTGYNPRYTPVTNPLNPRPLTVYNPSKPFTSQSGSQFDVPISQSGSQYGVPTSQSGVHYGVLGSQSQPPFPQPNIYRPSTHQSTGSPGHNSRRQYSWDYDSITTSIHDLNAALSNMTCVLTSINAIDGDLNIKYEAFINYYSDRPLDASLKGDLVDGVNMCRSYVECLPVEQLKSGLPWKLHRLLDFLKCEKNSRLTSCFKQDLRNNLDQFDLSALPDDGRRTEPVDQLMTILVGAGDMEVF
ncbi:uncharacterized protein LOC121854504 [Homarus americanus]|uniref:uncharacterized protein LOC121854504 n=1 Tax=Homarus americanus TaxID=6706 RepID=UPI001C48D675|nr:uncharacterized protein LOC121854504 [Homarus americanus]